MKIKVSGVLVEKKQEVLIIIKAPGSDRHRLHWPVAFIQSDENYLIVGFLECFGFCLV